MPTTHNGAPKSTERKVNLGGSPEAAEPELKAYFEKSEDYFNDIKSKHDTMSGDELEAALAEYKSLGGDKLDQLRNLQAANPTDVRLKEAVKKQAGTVHESYLNKNNEFAQMTKQEADELYATIADELPEENDPKFVAKLTELEQSLLADGGITPTQVELALSKAAERKEHAVIRTNGAPEGLPTTADLEKNEGKLNWRQKARRMLGMPSVYAGLGLAKVMDFTQRRNEEYKKKSERQEGESQSDFEKRLRKYDRRLALGAVAIGAVYLGVRAAAKVDIFDGMGGGGKPETIDLTPDNEVIGGGSNGRDEIDQYGRHRGADTPEGGADSAEVGENSSEFVYDQAEDPFYDENKTGPNNYGSALEADAEYDVEGVPGTAELRDSLIDSPNQLSTAAAEMHVDGFSRDNLDGMGAELMNNPDFAEMTYDQIAAIFDDPETKFSNGTLEPGTYGSYYQYEVDGQLYNAYDPTVNEAATTIVVDWKDENGNWHRTEFKRECGGQIIHRHPVEQASAPMGGGEYTSTVTNEYVPTASTEYTPPQGGGTPQPTGGTPPTRPTNPSVNPPSGGGDNPPPTILVPKDVAADINANSELPDYLQMGDQAGTIQPGELDTKPVAPPVEYTPDPAPSVSTEVANGAAPNDRTEVSGGTPEVVVPAPEAGVSGEAPTDVVTGRVEG
jgi:hypothetical protein